MRIKLFVIFVITLLAIPLSLPLAQARPYDYLPGGSYLNSCQNCSVNRNNTLRCQCTNNKGRVKNSFLYLDPNCGAVDNNDGNLHCTGKPGPGPVPRPDDGDRHGRSFEVDTGPIWNQSQAEMRCPRVCNRSGGEWTGSWNAGRMGQGSTCECRRTRQHRDEGIGNGFKIRF